VVYVVYDMEQLYFYLPSYFQVVAGGFIITTLAIFLTYGIFRAFSFLNQKI